jgi:hypothetical protein
MKITDGKKAASIEAVQVNIIVSPKYARGATALIQEIAQPDHHLRLIPAASNTDIDVSPNAG